MVYKVDKHGVRTGNSFKRWNTRYYRQYKKQAYILRSHTVNNENESQSFDDIVAFKKESVLGEGTSMVDGIEYSLNKQRRWELPEILENIILSSDGERNYGIQLVQRHRINQVSNCFNVCSTEGIYKGGDLNTDRKLKIKNSGGYFQSNSVLKRAPILSRKKRRDRRRRHLQQEDNNEEQQQEQIEESNKLRYEVLYPSPATSFLTHKTEAIGMYTHPDPRQRCKRRERMAGLIKESLQCMDDPYDDSEEEDGVYEADDCGHEERDYIFTLDDILKHANKANKLTSGKMRHNSNISSSSAEENELSSSKGRMVYIDSNESRKLDSNTVNNNSISTKRKTAKLQPVRVILKDETINQQTLAQTYGNDFIECDCFPRKFIVNISKQASRLNMFKSSCKSSFNQTEACIVFLHDVDNEVNNLKETVYKVFLKAKFGENLNSVQIETIFDYMETNVEEVVERTLFFIEKEL